jgi:hypothetical protein
MVLAIVRSTRQAPATSSSLQVAAIEVVDRFIQVEREVKVVERIEVSVPPSGPAWPAALSELAKQVDAGRVYDRDFPALAQTLDEVLRALARRPRWRRRRP